MSNSEEGLLSNPRPTKEEALQFALMLKAGMPASSAIWYFFDDPDEDPTRVQFELERWVRSKTVRAAINIVQGKSWEKMTLAEQIQFAIDKHYAELAYFLYSHNYSELSGQDKSKADTCRAALEAKLAGMAGKMDALSRFFEDVRLGVVKLGGLPMVPPTH